MAGDLPGVEAAARAEVEGLDERARGLLPAREARGGEDGEAPEGREKGGERRTIAASPISVKGTRGAGHERGMVTHTLSPLRVLSLTGALVALLSTGCTAPAVVGTDDSPSVGASGDIHGVAYHLAPDTTTLHVVISTLPVTCDNPGQGSDGDGSCPVSWTVTFALPAAAQAPGTYSLSDPQFESVSFQNDGSSGGSCVGGGGGSIDGTTVQVTGIDATHVKVTLGGFSANGLSAADGDYDVPVCP